MDFGSAPPHTALARDDRGERGVDILAHGDAAADEDVGALRQPGPQLLGALADALLDIDALGLVA